MKTNQSNYKANRATLKELSKVAKLAVKQGAFSTVNEALLSVYFEQGHKEFNTFSQWIDKGFAVKKGEKAFFVWGSPRKGANHEPENEQDEFSFFPLCYLFSDKQVEPIKERKNKQVAEVQISYKAKIAPQNRIKVGGSKESAEVLKTFFAPTTIEHHESFKILMLNRANQVLGAANISDGGISGTVADVRIILQYALLSNASAIILSHNHPSGNMKQSEEDTKLTNQIVNAAKYFDIHVLDHIILSPTGEYFSFADNGLI